MKLILRGTQRYWFHEGLVSIVEAETGWDAEKIKNFLSRNEWVHFNNLEKGSAKNILDKLEATGFEIQLQESKSDITASIGMAYEKELETLKQGIGVLSSRIEKLEEFKGMPSRKSIKQSEVYQKLVVHEKEVVIKQPVSQPIREESTSQGTAESNIGKYWLSRIGIFTLVLGIVLFISYSFQFIGPWGKILIGAALGASLIGLGNYLAPNEKYRRWAM